MAFTGEPTAAVIGRVAFAARFAGAAQVGIEHAAFLLIAPDVAVDGLVAGRERVGGAQVSGDLFGAPSSAEQSVDLSEVRGGEAPVAARA